MSGIAGIYNLDGALVDRALLERMTGALAHRGPDGIRYWVDGPVGMGHCMLQTTPESVYERQPLTDDSGNLCLTMDGRVDNREELIAAIESKGSRLRDHTDAEIVLKAYECWGTECPTRIIGDFSFVIWDKRQRQLFCARDAVGNKPFVYHWNGRRLLFSSELHALFEDAGTAREPNEGMIGEYLAVNITHTEETLYRGILRLPPAHYMIVRDGRIRKHCFWNVDLGKEIRYRSDDEYVEHFTQLFKECVRCSLRSHRPIGAYLSGGLDSSSVVSMAKTIYAEGLAEDRGFETFSMLYPGLPCDESRYIREVVERWNLHANYFCVDGLSLGCFQEQAQFYKDLSDYPNGNDSGPIRKSARKKQLRVMLTGFGGDERLSGSLYYLADFARKGEVLSLLRELRTQNLQLTNKQGLSKLLHYFVVPLLPIGVRALAAGTRRRAARRRGKHCWINPDFARRINLEERLGSSLYADVPVKSSREWFRTLFNNGGQIHAMELEDRSAAWYGQEQRHPFRDRRIVELCFALPENQRLRRYQKFVLRQAMRGFLPAVIRERRDKAEFSETLLRVVEDQSSKQVFWNLQLERLGWVDGDLVRNGYSEMGQRHGQSNESYASRAWPLWMVLALELWFTQAFGVQPLVSPLVEPDASQVIRN